MDVFPIDEDIAAEEGKRRERRGQILDDIKKDSTQKGAGAEESLEELALQEQLRNAKSGQSELAALDEEPELERLRKSEKLRQYAGIRGDSAATSVTSRRRQRSETGSCALKRSDVPERSPSKRPRVGPKAEYALRPSTRPVVLPAGESNSKKAGSVSNVRIRNEHPFEGNVSSPPEDEARSVRRASGTGSKRSSIEKREKQRLKIDPKIVDDSSDDSDSSDNDEENPGNAFREEDLPLSHEVAFGVVHEAPVSSIALDRTGSRVVTTSYGQDMKLWDFGTMDSNLRPFRSRSPIGEHSLSGAEFAERGSNILVYGSAHAARVLSRDGEELICCASGDMYSVDMARTKGHAAEVSSAAWRPTIPNQFCTTSSDGTLRLWDLNEARRTQEMVIKLRNRRGAKVGGSRLCFSPDGKAVVLGCGDSSLKIFDLSSYSPRPSLENASTFGDNHPEITCIKHSPISSSTPSLLVRSCDDALRLFDIRRFDEPLFSAHDLTCTVSRTQAIFLGETARYVVTGTGARRKSGENANLVFFDCKSLSEVFRTTVDIERGSVVSLAWHPSINQILYGCADGTVKVQYRPETSRAGVLQCVVKHQRRKQHGFAAVGVGEIYTPALHGESARRGRNARSSVISLPHQASIFQDSKERVEKQEDPREALLKHDAETRDKNIFGTRSVRILADKTAEQEEEESRLALRRKLQRNQAARQKE